jgi:hypothetical protein
MAFSTRFCNVTGLFSGHDTLHQYSHLPAGLFQILFSVTRYRNQQISTLLQAEPFIVAVLEDIPVYFAHSVQKIACPLLINAA